MVHRICRDLYAVHEIGVQSKQGKMNATNRVSIGRLVAEIGVGGRGLP